MSGMYDTESQTTDDNRAVLTVAHDNGIVTTDEALIYLGARLDELDSCVARLIDKVAPALMPDAGISPGPISPDGRCNAVTMRVLALARQVTGLTEAVTSTVDRVSL